MHNISTDSQKTMEQCIAYMGACFVSIILLHWQPPHIHHVTVSEENLAWSQASNEKFQFKAVFWCVWVKNWIELLKLLFTPLFFILYHKTFLNVTLVESIKRFSIFLLSIKFSHCQFLLWKPFVAISYFTCLELWGDSWTFISLK